ncbi:MAG TPA: hypothetical protein VF227_02445 [Actinomycetes bacterium]
MSEQDESVDDPRIAEALERLEGLADKPPAEPVEVYEDVHRVLQETLAEAQRDRDQSGGLGGARP